MPVTLNAPGKSPGATVAPLGAVRSPTNGLSPSASSRRSRMRGGAEGIVHAYPDGRAPGRERLLEMGIPHTIVPAAGTSEDVALLVADACGATGLKVRTVTSGEARPLPAAVELTAYRVIQEALTNVRQHAGPATGRPFTPSHFPVPWPPKKGYIRRD